MPLLTRLLINYRLTEEQCNISRHDAANERSCIKPTYEARYNNHNERQAGAELGQAQPGLGLDVKIEVEV